jgi:Ca2+-binding RTX toxin-like protein
MATVITTSTTTAGDNITLIDSEDIFVAEGVTRASTGGRGLAALFQSHTIDIQGTVYGETTGIDLGTATVNSTFSTLTIADTGSVMAHNDGILTRGSSIRVVNDGYIKGNRGLTHEGGSGFELVNNGTVIGAFGTAVSVNSSNSHVVNYGTIICAFVGSGIQLTDGTNSGFAPTLDNYGTITAVDNTAINGDVDDLNAIRNFGEITGDIDLGFVSDTVLNSGRIVGDIDLFGGVDRYDGRVGQLFGTVFGGSGDDTILTGSQDDFINGGFDVDTMAGGLGDDTYTVDNSADKVIEAAGGGNDTVQSSASFVLAANLETLTLIGGLAINGTGNATANSITGNNVANTLNGGLGNDILDGGIGNDKLFGGAGNDRLTGGANADAFVFNTALNASTNRDAITDFSHVDDTFHLENAIFTKLGAGVHALNPLFFRAGAVAADANDYIVYNKASGLLSYDADGNGAGHAVAFALLTNKPTLAANDFLVI